VTDRGSTQRQKVVVIINPISGGARPGEARDRAERAAAILTAAAADGEIFVTERKDHARNSMTVPIILKVRFRFLLKGAPIGDEQER